MNHGIATSSLKSYAAPGLQVARRSSAEAQEPVESFHQSAPETEESSWGTKFALVGLGALSLAPVAVQAADVGDVVSDHVPALSSLFDQKETKVGEYNLTFRGADIDINPRLQHFKPGLRLKGDFLRSEFAKTEQLGNGWTQTQGLRGVVHGQVTTYGDQKAEVNVEAFRRWEGTVGKDVKTLLEVSAGNYHDILNGTNSVGVSARQELKGGNFEWLGQPLSWNIEGRQSYRHVTSGKLDPDASPWNYEVLVGVRRDFPMKLFGREGTVSVTAGPEFEGNANQSFKVSPKVKVRARF